MLAVRRAFLAEQVRCLQPLGFVAFIVECGDGIAFVEVTRNEDGGYDVHADAEPSLPEAAREQLVVLGFVVDDAHPAPSVTLADAAVVAETVEHALAGAFGFADDAPLDVHHGSHRVEIEQQRMLDALRDRIAGVLRKLLDEGSVEVDADGDFTFSYESTRVWVALRLVSDEGPLIVRVMSVTNVDIEPASRLGLFLAETNFGLPFGRFSLDPYERAVWFEETMLGEHLDDDELRTAIGIVASTADEFDERISRLFGGRVFNQPAGAEMPEPPSKPGTAGYL